MTDVHGYSEKLLLAAEHYGDDVRYVMGGDFINKGPDSRGVMDTLAELEDVVLVSGNHEWALMAALSEEDPERRRVWLERAWLRTPHSSGTESHFLASYGIRHYRRMEDIRKATAERLQELEHYALFEGMELYYEDDGMVVVHAGLDPKTSWQKQRASLDKAKNMQRQHVFARNIKQLNSRKLSREVRRPKDMDETLVTGHARPHRTDRRIWRSGTQVVRVMLDSALSAGNDMLVYESWSGSIREF
ncbi:MAG TPA: metallophosphoesterase [Candidatus Saccharimonadales bacterium]|nr:metallophosphoesterase [Candidatus Saccharimonadales bacterium]